MNEMLSLLEKFENFCKMSSIDLDEQLKTLKENQRVDYFDVNEKYEAKIQILKNALKQFLAAENQTISDEHLEFIIKLSNLF